MSTTTVTTQAELDKALADKVDTIYIDSPTGVWLQLTDPGSSRVEARGSSSVEAWESSSVVAWDSSSVEAGSHTAVHLHSGRVTVKGGVVIDHTTVDQDDPAQWAAYRGVTVTDGEAILYKAVDSDLYAGQSHLLTAYPIGETVTAPDWKPSRGCGHGLHFSPHPVEARGYFNGDGVPRYLECAVPLADLVPLNDKCKAPSCRVLREVDAHREAVSA